MKKYVSVFLVGCLLFSLAACGETQTGGSLSAANAAAEQTDDAGAELTLLCDNSSSFSNHFGTEDGFYYFTQPEQISSDLSGMHLMYIDYATGKEVYLCSDSGCLHDSETCSSVFSSDEFGYDSIPFVHCGYLYILSRDFDSDGETSIDLMGGGSEETTESHPAALYRMGLDGSDRQKIYTFPENTTVEKLVISDGEDLWFVTKTLEFDQDGSTTYTTAANRTLSKFSLSGNEITDTIPLDFGDGIYQTVIGCSGTQFVLKGVEYPDGMDEKDAMRLGDDEWRKIYNSSSTIYSTLDVSSREKKEIYKGGNDGTSKTCAVKDAYLYSSSGSDGGILKLDLNTGEGNGLANLSENYIYYVLNDSLCCMSTGTEDDNTLYFVDLQTGDVKHCTLTNKLLGWPLTLLAETQTHVLVVYDYEANPHTDDSYEITKYKYALITKEDLYNSNGNYEPITMVGSGI